MNGLRTMQSKVQAEHTSCHHVVQEMPGYPQCSGKIWKYDWAPAGQKSSTRKCWRLIVVVPEPTSHPLRLVAAAFYAKQSTDQLSNKQLSLLFARVINPQFDSPQAESPAFQRTKKSDGSTVSICLNCGETVGGSKILCDLDTGEQHHKKSCAGPITA